MNKSLLLCLLLTVNGWAQTKISSLCITDSTGATPCVSILTTEFLLFRQVFCCSDLSNLAPQKEFLIDLAEGNCIVQDWSKNAHQAKQITGNLLSEQYIQGFTFLLRLRSPGELKQLILYLQHEFRKKLIPPQGLQLGISLEYGAVNLCPGERVGRCMESCCPDPDFDYERIGFFGQETAILEKFCINFTFEPKMPRQIRLKKMAAWLGRDPGLSDGELEFLNKYFIAADPTAIKEFLVLYHKLSLTSESIKMNFAQKQGFWPRLREKFNDFCNWMNKIGVSEAIKVFFLAKAITILNNLGSPMDPSILRLISNAQKNKDHECPGCDVLGFDSPDIGSLNIDSKQDMDQEPSSDITSIFQKPNRKRPLKIIPKPEELDL